MMRPGAGRRLFAGWAPWIAAVVVLGSCKKEGEPEAVTPGMTDVALPSPPEGVHFAVPPDDLRAASARGRLLFDLERAVALGWDQGVHRIGPPPDAVVLPIADVDPGGRSGQVVFVRFPIVGGVPVIEVARGERFLLVSLGLAPDRVLDLEQVHGELEDPNLRQRVEAILAATARVATLAPDGVFHMHALVEQQATGSHRAPVQQQVRVYALAAAAGGLDLELTIDPAGRKSPATVREVVRVHEPGAVGATIRVTTPTPGPITVMRVLERGPGAGDVVVEAVRGARWRVSAATGQATLERGGAAGGL